MFTHTGTLTFDFPLRYRRFAIAARRLAAFAVLAAIGTAGAEESGRAIREKLAERLDLFSLCSREGRMDLVVDALPEHAARAGLMRDGIRDVIESRLRRVRLHDPNAEPLLHAVIVLGESEEGHIPFYSIELRYLRDLLAEPLGLAALAETWSTGGAGQGDADSFLAHLGGLVDEFIAEYLRVRDSEACREEPRKPGPGASG